MAVVSSAEFASYVNERDDGTDNAELTIALDAAELAVNDYCNRQIALATAVSARLYAAPPHELLRVHDCTSITSITVGGSVLTSSQWQAEPLNQITFSGEARPIEQVRLLDGPWSSLSGASNARAAVVSVVAAWGWSSIPKRVKLATLMVGADLYAGRDKRFGVISLTEFAGVRVRENPQVVALLDGYVRVESFGMR
jgi:hypothetical protein